MPSFTQLSVSLLSLAALGSTFVSQAQDWPQWRGSNRDAKVTSFKAPAAWPKELTRKWSTPVGEGVATPALVGDKIYVFSRQDGNEITRCLDAATGKEIWQDKYEALGASGPAQSFSGPRSSPAVGEGKVVTIGVRGMISCLDAATGKKLWRKDEFQNYPQFHPSSSPIILDGLCIAQLGGRENGATVAYDLATGTEKWKWSGGSTAYASPVVQTGNGKKLILSQTDSKLGALNASDGKLVWEASNTAQGGGGGGGGRGGGRDYKATTPILDGSTIILAGRGIKAMTPTNEGGVLTLKEVWNNQEATVSFNTPVLRNGLLFGLSSGNEVFCLSAKDGQKKWSGSISVDSPEAGGGGGGRGGRGGRGGGFGSIVDAGPVLIALTPSAQLLVLEPNDKELKQLASYKVADGGTHAHPVLSGNHIFIKDNNSVTLWTIE